MTSTVLLFLSGSDLMLIMFVALLLFGGDKLPEIARGLGKGIRDFKDASEGVKREINNQINNYEDKKAETAAANTTPAALPEATEAAAPVSIEPVAIADEHASSAEEISSVPNTMPLAEHQVYTPADHANEDIVEAVKTSKGAEAEPVKTTHE